MTDATSTTFIACQGTAYALDDRCPVFSIEKIKTSLEVVITFRDSARPAKTFTFDNAANRDAWWSLNVVARNHP